MRGSWENKGVFLTNYCERALRRFLSMTLPNLNGIAAGLGTC
jgi:hypothetical protein